MTPDQIAKSLRELCAQHGLRTVQITQIVVYGEAEAIGPITSWFVGRHDGPCAQAPTLADALGKLPPVRTAREQLDTEIAESEGRLARLRAAREGISS